MCVCVCAADMQAVLDITKIEAGALVLKDEVLDVRVIASEVCNL